MTVATPTIQLTSDSGDKTDLITNSANLTFSTATGVTRTYQINEDQATSKYEVPPEDGEYTVLVTDTDSLGSSASASVTFTLDTVDPTTPVVSLESDTGESLTDRVTAYAYLTENASEVGATRSYSLNGAASDSYAMPSVDGSYVLVVTDTDAAGNYVSATLEFTLDTTLLTPTAVLSLDSGDGADGITNAAGVTFSLLASGDTRSYTINDGDASDEFLTPTAEGTYKVVVIDTDAAGNTDTATLLFEFDQTLKTPTASLADDSGDSKEDLITNSAALSLSVQDEDATRSYQVDNLTASDIYVAPTDQGSHTVLVTDTDTAGNTAKVRVSFSLDTTLTTPTVAFASGSDTGSSAQDAISNSAALTFNSKDEDATRVYTLSKAGVQVASGAEYAAPSADGVYDLSVTDTDTAGNTKSASQRFTLDTTAPTAPLISSVDSGSKGDGITNSAALTFNDKDVGATRSYSLSVNGADPVVGAQYSAPTVDGVYVLVVQDTDTAGNSSSAEISFTLDASLTQTSVSLEDDSGTNKTDLVTNNAALSLNQKDEDATRTYQVDGGSASQSYVLPVLDGSHIVLVTDTDVAGNVKTASLTFTLDTFISAPTVALANGYTGTGTTASAAMVFNTKDAGATRIYTITVGAVSTPYTEYVAPVYNGSYEVTVTDTDSAGNKASASVDFTLYTVLAIPTVELTINSGDKSDTISNAAALTFSTAAPDVTRTYTLNGAASATYVAPTADGVYTMVVTDVDSAQDTESVSYSFTLDRTLAAPTLSLLTNSGDASDAVTKVAGLALSAAAADVTRTYTVNGVAVDALDPATDGPYAIVVKDTDQAGNEKSVSLSFTLDTNLTTPTLNLDHGITDGIANSAAMTFNAPDSDATRVYTITSNGVGVGVSSASYVVPKVSGFYQVAVTDTDTAGNVASASLDFTLEIIGKTVDFQAYHWKSHALLGDVVISDGSQTVTTENGLGQFTAVTESTLLVTAERSIPALEADITSAAVNLQDAIAILKMVVGLDVNGSNKALSPYQALAADFNGDGVVSLTDAIGVLKHVVGLTQTAAPHWAFANEADLTVPAKANTTPGAAPAISSVLGDAVDVHFGLVGYLVGDVDGSFAGLSTASNLLTSDSTYFTDLVTATSGLSLSQFGVYSQT
jgi:hypothetical protein